MYHLLKYVQPYSPQLLQLLKQVLNTQQMSSANAAATNIAFICFLLFFLFNFTSPPKYIIRNVLISRINDNDFHYHCQLKK